MAVSPNAFKTAVTLVAFVVNGRQTFDTVPNYP